MQYQYNFISEIKRGKLIVLTYIFIFITAKPHMSQYNCSKFQKLANTKN